MGDIGPHRRLERPVGPGVGGLLLVGGQRPRVDPRLEPPDLLGRERLPLSRRGHPEVLAPDDRLDEQALGTMARDDRGTTISPRADAGRGVETQARLLLQGPMTGNALPSQDRLDVALVRHRHLGTEQPRNGEACHERQSEQLHRSPGKARSECHRQSTGEERHRLSTDVVSTVDILDLLIEFTDRKQEVKTKM